MLVVTHQEAELGTSRSRERITKPCDHCAAPVTRLKSADAPRFYCNRACYWASANRAKATAKNAEARRLEARIVKQCERCGKEVARPRSQLNGTTFCSRECQYLHRREQGRKFVNSSGYVVIGVPADTPGARKNGQYGQILEHRFVMQEHLGRPLLPLENVHHVNGDKTDNRIENLELWSTSQPQGQRVTDKIRWAKEFLRLYEGVAVDGYRQEDSKQA